MKTISVSAGVWGVFLGSTLLAVPPPAPAQITAYDVNVHLPQFILYTDPYKGNQVKLGGFSGLYPVPGKPDSFYTITDRGPTTDIVDADGITRKTWVIPGFGPHIVTVRLMPNGTAVVNEVKPLKRPNGGQITGLPTTNPATDIPYDFDLNVLPFDEDSLDAEGITIDPWGNFWVCEEYKPSVAMIAPNGKVQFRLAPKGTLTGLEQVPTYDVLPAVLSKRRSNRGLEGIAASADGILYSIMQRPLNNPKRADADANGNVRLVAINLNTLFNPGPGSAPLVEQYLYKIPAVPNNITLSDVFSTAPGKLLISERVTDKLYEVDVTGASDISTLENPDTGKLLSDASKTFEQLDAAGLAALNVVPVSKTVIIDSLLAISPLLDKIEGVCKVGNNILITYDNDFNVWELASTPANPNPNGPQVQLELIGENYPKIWVVPQQP